MVAIGGPTQLLACGLEMPMVALGTWKSPPAQTVAAVCAALEAGYRFIDTANDYNIEPQVGEGLAASIEAGVVKREDVFIQTKLWNTNHRKEHVRADLEQTLEDLGLTYVDSFVIHWPQASPSTGKQASTRPDGAFPAHYSKNPMFPVDDDGYFCADEDSHFVETWRAMEALVDVGLCKAIGLSNFNRRQVEEVVRICRHPVSVLQCECHPYLQQRDLVEYCRAQNIAFQAYSPLGSGDTNLALEPPPSGVIPLKDPLVLRLAEKYEKNAGQIVLKWHLQRGVALATKSANPARVKSNFELFDWTLEDEDCRAIDALDCGWRHLLWRETSNHPDYPFKDELPLGYELEKPPLVSSSGTGEGV